MWEGSYGNLRQLHRKHTACLDSKTVITLPGTKKPVSRPTLHYKTRKNAIVEYLDYQIPVTQLSQGPKGNGDMQAAKRD